MAKVKVSPKGPVEYPSSHKPGMRVAKGGSCCANCKYWSGSACTNKFFIAWNGSGNIPAPPDQYCSDWWMPKE